jgi:hypothetical protein
MPFVVVLGDGSWQELGHGDRLLHVTDKALAEAKNTGIAPKALPQRVWNLMEVLELTPSPGLGPPPSEDLGG